jgi:hypothetical protein
MQTGLEEAMECEKPLEKRKEWKRIFMVVEQKLEFLSFEVWRSGRLSDGDRLLKSLWWIVSCLVENVKKCSSVFFEGPHLSKVCISRGSLQ